VPKTRGRRPAPNPKKRVQRQGIHASLPLAPIDGPSEREPEAAVRAVSAPPRSTGSFITARRAAVPATPKRRFLDSVAEYAYVPQDLRRIGLLSGSLLVLLVVLSFFVR
jgi:hypothetical protein